MPNVPIDQSTDFPSAAAEEAFEKSGAPPVTVVWPGTGFTPGESVGYLGFGVALHYRWHSGLSAAPLAAGARTRVAIWRHSSETTHVCLTAVACRVGSVPQMPHFDLGPNCVLLEREISAPSPEYFADGSTQLTVMLRCLYVMQMAQHVEYDSVIVPNSALNISADIQLIPSQFSRLLAPRPTQPGDFTGSAITY